MDYTHIRIKRKGLHIGNRVVEAGDEVAVAEIGAATAQTLIDNQRAEAVKPATAEKGK